MANLKRQRKAKGAGQIKAKSSSASKGPLLRPSVPSSGTSSRTSSLTPSSINSSPNNSSASSRQSSPQTLQCFSVKTMLDDKSTLIINEKLISKIKHYFQFFYYILENTDGYPKSIKTTIEVSSLEKFPMGWPGILSFDSSFIITVTDIHSTLYLRVEYLGNYYIEKLLIMSGGIREIDIYNNYNCFHANHLQNVSHCLHKELNSIEINADKDLRFSDKNNSLWFHF